MLVNLDRKGDKWSERLIFEVKDEKANITPIPYYYSIGELFPSSYSSNSPGIAAET